MSDLDRFVQGYIACALWSTNDDSTPQGGDPLDENYDIDDIAPETLAKMRAECEDFMQSNAEDLKDIDPTFAGHDFWLTRNGHGVGYWDRGLGEVGSRLTTACKPYGTVSLYVGGDGLIYSQ